jgi:L-aspartate oxidase
MLDAHPLADLAPRDVVSRAIVARMRLTGTDHVYLDARHLGRSFLEQRFPSIVARCRELGFDPATDLLPVAPAQHYASGGVRTDLHGRSSLPGLYACGEVSCTGVHGANRLASNSLLEGLVFAHRIADDVSARLAAGDLPQAKPVEVQGVPALVSANLRTAVQSAMTAGAGAVRSAGSLADAAAALTSLSDAGPAEDPGPLSWETTNLLHVGQVLTFAAALREESRGGHVRSDYLERDDQHWRGHSVVARDIDGTITARFEPVPEQDLA